MTEVPDSPQPPLVVPSEPAEDVQNDAVIGRALRWSAGVVAVGVVAVGVALLWNRLTPAPVAPEAGAVVLPEVRAASVRQPPSIPFTDVTTAAGLTFRHENWCGRREAAARDNGRRLRVFRLR